MISEFGVDAYDTDCVSDTPGQVGCEDEHAQAEWLLSLIEDIERHAAACAVGCAPEYGKVAIGGAVIGWADEWWKGRVIDAVEFDERTAAMGDACPDPWATKHTACGYPSPAQPDSYVNEEWFGLFAIDEACANNVDRLRARQAWHRLRLLWKEGGCIGRFSTQGVYELRLRYANSSEVDGRSERTFGLASPYNVSEYPYCADGVVRLRLDLQRCASVIELVARTGNTSLLPPDCRLASLLEWDGTDCALQALLASTGSGECPAVPSHMANLNQSVRESQAGWEPTPAECPVGETVYWLQEYAGMLALAAAAALMLGAVNHRLVALACRRRSRASAAACASASAALSPTRARSQSRRKRRGSLQYDGAAAARPPSDPLLTGNDAPLALPEGLDACMREPLPPTDVVSAETRSERDSAVRTLLMPIGRMCADTFGFQASQLQPSSNGGPPTKVLSSLDNQVDHLVALLSQRLDRQPGGGALTTRAPPGEDVSSPRGASPRGASTGGHVGQLFSAELGGSPSPPPSPPGLHQPTKAATNGFELALERAVAELHEAMLGSYMRWVKLVDLRGVQQVGDQAPVRITVGSFAFAELVDAEAMQSEASCKGLCNIQLHRLLLYLLCWGEAANLRLLPECLNFIFYCASHALLLPPPGRGEDAAGHPQLATSPSLPSQPHLSLGPVATLRGVSRSLAAPGYLDAIVTPLYELLASHAARARRQQQEVAQCVLYDDMNELFWDRRLIRSLLPSLKDSSATSTVDKDGSSSPYADLRTMLQEAHAGGLPAVRLRELFQKTYRERVSWLHLTKNYARIFALHLVAFHAMVAVAANDGAWEWRHVSTATLTYSLFATSMRLVGLWTGVGGLRSFLRNLLPLLLHLSVPALFVAEFAVCGLSSEWLGASRPAVPNACFDYFTQSEVLQQAIYGHNLSGHEASATTASVTAAPYLASAVGMRSVFEIVALAYTSLLALGFLWPNAQNSLLFLFTSASGPRTFIRTPAWTHLSTRLVYSLLWLIILALKFIFEYYLVVLPVLEPSLCLWRNAGARFYCWAYDVGHGECSTFIPNITITDSATGAVLATFPEGRGFGDAWPEWGIAEGPGFSDGAEGYLRSVRSLRSVWYTLMLLATRWATPLMLSLADTAIFYNVVAAVCSFALASSRGLYHTNTWATMVCDLPTSVRLFNEKILARRRGVSLLPKHPRTLEWFLSEAASEAEHVQRYHPSIEACSTEWRAFAMAWNQIIATLRRNDYLSDTERDELRFEVLTGHGETQLALGCDAYVVLPTMCMSPIFQAGFWKRASNYPSTLRSMLQVRDLMWSLLVQMRAVADTSKTARQAFLCALTCWAEAEERQRRRRRSGDAGPLIDLLTALKEFVQTLVDVRDELMAATGKAEGACGWVGSLGKGGEGDCSGGSGSGGSGSGAGVVDVGGADRTTSLLALRTTQTADGGWTPHYQVARGLQHLVKAMENAEVYHQEKKGGGRGSVAQRMSQRLSSLATTSTRASSTANAQDTSSAEAAPAFSEPLRELKRLLRIDATPAELADRLQLSALTDQPTVLHALRRCLATANPGSEPRSQEARRQLIFFCNSLHNTQLRQPCPLSQMRCVILLTAPQTAHLNSPNTIAAPPTSSPLLSGRGQHSRRITRRWVQSPLLLTLSL